MAKTPKSETDVTASHPGLPWYQSLEAKLGLAFMVLLALLAGGAYWANLALVRDGLFNESQRYENEVASRSVEALDDDAVQAHRLANSLAQLAAQSALSPANLRLAAQSLTVDRSYNQLVAAFGIWPAPSAGTSSASQGAGVLWLRDGKGRFVPHDEVNRSATPYFREPWYTPGSYVATGSCYWTGLREELISGEPVVSCVTPIKSDKGFVGVVTVSIAVEALQERLNRLQRSRTGYALLIDQQAKLLAASANAQSTFGAGSRGKTLTELGKSNSALLTLAERLRKQAEKANGDVVKSSKYRAKTVSELKDATANLSRQQAERILVSIWGQKPPTDAVAEPMEMALKDDSVLKEAARSAVYNSVESAWQVVLVSPASNSFTGVSYVFVQALVATLLLVTVTLLLVFYIIRAMVLRPLRLFAQQLESSANAESGLHVTLDESARNEVGVLAHWQNTRTRQLADALSSSRAVKTQLSAESGERRQLEEQLARSQERATLALESVSDAVLIVDGQGLVEDMNPAAEKLTGISSKQARRKPLEEVLKTHVEGELTTPNYARMVIERAARIELPSSLSLTSMSGAHYAISLTAEPMTSRGKAVGVVVVARERGEPNASGGAVPLAADGAPLTPRDAVTGLPNRGSCERRLDALLEQARLGRVGGSLIFLDIDHLKRVNDFGGQPAGDDVLVRVAETLAGIAPKSQDVYRLAADQFAVIAEGTEGDTGMAVAEALRAQLAGTRFYWESRYFSVTASFGVCPISAEQPSALEVIRRADDACAAAKRAGRNNVQLYDPRMDRVGRVVDDDAWVRCIRAGIDESLFHLRTQWIMPSSEHAGEGHCFEILLALEDEEGFWASPAAFMPVAERHHLMAEIDRWVIANTLSHLESHPKILDGLSYCSINLSVLTITNPDFIEFMVAQLEHRPGMAGKLCFEVREHSLTEHPQAGLACCDALHKMGCRIAVDHYLGRYMSDLTLLRRLPVDFVKIDALSFKNLSSDPVEQMLAESTLRIARHLRRRVVVTGIEDPRSQETWRKLGANYFQGFAFAKPSPVVFLPPD